MIHLKIRKEEFTQNSLKKEIDKMAKCVTYIRDVEGKIERKPNAITSCPDDNMDPYFFEEPLVGFPETKVYWANQVGPSVGIAPTAS
jgi:hypothetical protein